MLASQTINAKLQISTVACLLCIFLKQNRVTLMFHEAQGCAIFVIFMAPENTPSFLHKMENERKQLSVVEYGFAFALHLTF